MRWQPDPSFYPSPRMAMEAQPEKLAYVALLSPIKNGRTDAIAVIDVDPESKSYGRTIGSTDMPVPGDELHHFGWNACSSCLCPYAPHPHMDRRYLIVPGLHSSRVHILDTKPDPVNPKIVKVIEPETLMNRAGYSRPHTVHCGPEGIYMNGLGSPSGEGPGGIFLMDPQTFEIRGAWEAQRGPQYLAYDFAWHLGHDAMVTSEWGTPNMFENGLDPELLLGGKYGHQLHFWDLGKRQHKQVLDLGPEQQLVLELRPARNPTKAYGFVGVVISLKDLSSSVWLWRRNSTDGKAQWKVSKVIEIPAEPADPETLPPMLKGFRAVPPLVTDINLSLDDRFLYVSCWGSGEFRQYDVSDPFHPRLNSTIRLGGIVTRAAHPSKPGIPLNGGPQMVELSFDGRRAYVTNSLYTPLDEQFYPDGIKGWMARIETDGPLNQMRIDSRFLPEFDSIAATPNSSSGWRRLL
jgi:methanethiol oxidase